MFADVINHSADALMGIVNDILDFSKASAGKLVLEEADFEPLLAVEGAVDVLVWCPLPMLLLAHGERGTEHFFPRPLTESGGRGKNVVGGGEGLDSAMRSRDDLRRPARTLFPGQRRRSRRANQ
jgi:hypothetical protein